MRFFRFPAQPKLEPATECKSALTTSSKGMHSGIAFGTSSTLENEGGLNSTRPKSVQDDTERFADASTQSTINSTSFIMYTDIPGASDGEGDDEYDCLWEEELEQIKHSKSNGLPPGNGCYMSLRGPVGYPSGSRVPSGPVSPPPQQPPTADEVTERVENYLSSQYVAHRSQSQLSQNSKEERPLKDIQDGVDKGATRQLVVEEDHKRPTQFHMAIQAFAYLQYVQILRMAVTLIVTLFKYIRQSTPVLFLLPMKSFNARKHTGHKNTTEGFLKPAETLANPKVKSGCGGGDAIRDEGNAVEAVVTQDISRLQHISTSTATCSGDDRSDFSHKKGTSWKTQPRKEEISNVRKFTQPEVPLLIASVPSSATVHEWSCPRWGSSAPIVDGIFPSATGSAFSTDALVPNSTWETGANERLTNGLTFKAQGSTSSVLEGLKSLKGVRRAKNVFLKALKRTRGIQEIARFNSPRSDIKTQSIMIGLLSQLYNCKVFTKRTGVTKIYCENALPLGLKLKVMAAIEAVDKFSSQVVFSRGTRDIMISEHEYLDFVQRVENAFHTITTPERRVRH